MRLFSFISLFTLVTAGFNGSSQSAQKNFHRSTSSNNVPIFSRNFDYKTYQRTHSEHFQKEERFEPITLNQDDPHSGTITPYRVIMPKSVRELNFQGYNILKTWAVFRHGTRAQSTEDKMSWKEKARTIINSMNHTDFKDNEWYADMILNLNQWVDKFEEDSYSNKGLVNEGTREMKALGIRYRNRFKKFIPKNFNESIQVITTNCSRTTESAEFFLSGMFQENSKKFYDRIQILDDSDITLHFDTNCDKWTEVIKRSWLNKLNNSELFDSNLMESVVNNFNIRYATSNAISKEHILTIAEICFFETAWDATIHSPWCNLLTEEDKKIIEYYHDTVFYNNDGYSSSLTVKIACVLFNDMYNFFTNDSYGRVRLLFTHVRTLLKFVAHLGLFKDDENFNFTTFDYKNYSDTRKWKTTIIGAFSSNLFLTLYLEKNNSRKYVLLTYQERILQIPGCYSNENMMCPWETFQEIFENSIQNCNYNDLCDLREIDEQFGVPESEQTEKERRKEQQRKEKRKNKAKKNH